MGFLALLVSFLIALFLWKCFELLSGKKAFERTAYSTKNVAGPSTGAYYGLFLGLLSLVIFLVFHSPYCAVPALLGLGYCFWSILRGYLKFGSFVFSGFVGCCFNGLLLLSIYGWFLGMWYAPTLVK